MFTIELTERAILDVEKARDWYEENEAGLGQRFIHALKNSVETLSLTPFFAIRYKKIRCIPLQKFPFMIHYQVFPRKQKIIVVAVFHTSRRPFR